MGLLVRFEGRSGQALTGWLDAQPQAWRGAITHVSIDLSAPYAKGRA